MEFIQDCEVYEVEYYCDEVDKVETFRLVNSTDEQTWSLADMLEYASDYAHKGLGDGHMVSISRMPKMAVVMCDAAANKGPTPPRRPAAYLIGSYMGMSGTWITYYANDNKSVAKVEFRSLGGETILVPPKPKPRWYEFWRLGEIDPYDRW